MCLHLFCINGGLLQVEYRKLAIFQIVSKLQTLALLRSESHPQIFVNVKELKCFPSTIHPSTLINCPVLPNSYYYSVVFEQ